MPTYVRNRSIPPSDNDRLINTSFSGTVVKGQLNKFEDRLAAANESQESARTVMGTVTTDKLNHGIVTGGPFTVGETVTGGTSAATGTVFVVSGAYLTYTPVLGTFVAAETITGGTSAATAVISTVDTPNLVGQIVKIPHDNVSGLLLTVESRPAGETLDDFEASEANLQLAWVAADVVALRDTTNKTTGSASIKFDNSDVLQTYTYTFNELEHGAVTGGPFVVDETITGGTSGATATVILPGTGQVHLVSVVGTFQSGEVITGGTSGATATTTSILETTEDWSTAASLNFDMLVSDKTSQQLQLTISDGVNSSVQVFTATSAAADGGGASFTEQSADLSTLAAAGAPAAVNLGAISSIIFAPITNSKAGYFIDVDNLRTVDDPGKLGIRFYDLGATLPVSGVATLASGTAKDLGDLGIDGSATAMLSINLKGGKELLLASGFSHGAAKEIPSNTLLTIDNYYAIVMEYVDVNVDIYGTDPSFSIDYYADGFAFTAPDTATTITSLGGFYDCMFQLFTAQDTWIDKVVVTFDADPEGAHYWMVIEDTGMKARVLGQGSAHGLTLTFDHGKSPVYLPSGGKVEFYHTDVFGSDVTRVTVSVDHWTANYDAYVANP